jgi:hypothetical protein
MVLKVSKTKIIKLLYHDAKGSASLLNNFSVLAFLGVPTVFKTIGGLEGVQNQNY